LKQEQCGNIAALGAVSYRRAMAEGFDIHLNEDQARRLKAVAEGSGGTVRRVAASGGIEVPCLQITRGGRLGGADWIGFRPSDSATVRGVEVYPLGIGLWALAALAAAVLAMWLVEGRRGRAA